MPSPVIVVLDTTVAETGPAQRTPAGFRNKDKPLRFSAVIGAGDTVVIEGKANAADTYATLHTFTDGTPADIYPPLLWRARRTVDGVAGDSKIRAENPANLRLTAHA
jgi:hypothetical protein